MNTNKLLSLFLTNGCMTSCKMPFRKDGFLWATNGYMALQIPDTPECTLELNDNAIFLPLVGQLIAGIKLEDCTVSLDFALGEKPCDECNVDGYTKKFEQVKCPDCDGYGEFQHGNHTYYCKNCDETGWVDGDKFAQETCDCCKGTGKMHGDHRINGTLFNGRLLGVLKMLSGVKMWVNPEAGKASTFVFDGGRGVIMPMRG